MLLIVSSLFVYLLVTRAPFDLTVLRAQGRPFVVTDDGTIENTMRFKIVNRTGAPRSYRVESMDPEIQFIATDVRETTVLAPLETAVEPFRVRVPPARFVKGHVDVEVSISSDDGQSLTRFVRLVGPANDAASVSVGRNAR
jgi:polyferredoxin